VSAPIPVGLVGAGKHGERYLRHVVGDLPELGLRLLCRRDENAGRDQARRAGARFVADFRDLVASPEIAAVIVVVPPTLNADICAAAARAGKAILVEKPLAATVAEGVAIRRAVEAASVPLMMAHTLRFNSVVRTVRDEADRVGSLHQVCLSQRFEPSRLDWLDDLRLSGGGNLLHTGVHGFDLLRFFTGENPSAVSARTARVAVPGAVLGSVSGSRATASRSGAIEIVGEQGQIVADHVDGWAFRVTGTRRAPLTVPAPAQTVRETLRAFVSVLRDAAPPPVTIEDGLWTVAMAEACYRSAQSNRAEAIAVD
jgi:predicted dehydrogenase